jgi:nucleotide-binding universal stress UspA family protein
VAAAERAPSSVLLLRPGTVITGRPLLAYDGSPGAERALEAAVRLTEGDDGGLTVALVAETEAQARDLRRRVEERLESTGLTARFQRVPDLTLDTMCRLSAEASADVLVLHADNPLLADRAHERLLERLGCAVLLVR